MERARKYQRPKRKKDLTSAEKKRLLDEYFRKTMVAASRDRTSLNRKLGRAHFQSTLDKIGTTLLAEATRLSRQHGPVKEFLDENPLPASMASLLPAEYRAFCLLLNAVKQWVSAEQAATDRYLLGGAARPLLRSVSATCVLTGEPFDGRGIELHHPVRDGRPPVPLLKDAHAEIESQVRRTDDPLMATISPLKRHYRRSWILLREGLEHLRAEEGKTQRPPVRPNARSFAAKVLAETGASTEDLLEWMDSNGLAA